MKLEKAVEFYVTDSGHRFAIKTQDNKSTLIALPKTEIKTVNLDKKRELLREIKRIEDLMKSKSK